MLALQPRWRVSADSTTKITKTTKSKKLHAALQQSFVILVALVVDDSACGAR